MRYGPALSARSLSIDKPHDSALDLAETTGVRVDLKTALKADFGIEVKIAGGIGQRAAPYIIEPCSADESVRTQLDLLRGLGRGRGELWRLLKVETVDANGNLQVIGIEAVQFTEQEIITERRALYFDVSSVDGQSDASAPAPMWSDPRTTFEAPSQIGWLHFDRATDNAPGQSRLDVSLFYSAVGVRATVYVYTPADPSFVGVPASEARVRELTAASEQIRSINPGAEAPWPILVSGPFALQHFLIGPDLSVLGIALIGSQIVKLRLTFSDDLKMRELMSATIQDLAALVASHQR